MAQINFYKSRKELMADAKKKTDCSSMVSDMNVNHYRAWVVTYKGWRDSCRSHGHSKWVRNDYKTAWAEREANIAKYVEQYNAKHPELETLEELSSHSVWLDKYSHTQINGYHHTSENVKFHKVRAKDEPSSTRLYFGVELELTFREGTVEGYSGDRYDACGDYDCDGEYDEDGNYIPEYYSDSLADVASHILEILGGMAVGEYDGSLASGRSFELISIPMTNMAWHDEGVQSRWREAMEYAIQMGAEISQPDENGFHIHVSRDFFEHNTDRASRYIEQDLNWVFQRYQEEVEVIGGRQYNRWCKSAKMDIKQRIANDYGITVEKARMSKDNLYLPQYDHGKAFIRSDSGNTYESRVFHSTLDFDRVLACIEFMRDISHGARDGALENKTFGQITKYKDSPFLQKLIKKIKYEQKQKLALNKKNTNTMVFSVA